MVKRGYSFTWDDGGNGEHTWVILTDIFDGKVIVVNISSYKEFPNDPNFEVIFNDQTMIMNTFDVPTRYISRKSYFFYKEAKVLNVADIYAIDEENDHFLEAWPVRIVDKAATGLIESKRTPKGVQTFYRSLYLS